MRNGFKLLLAITCLTGSTSGSSLLFRRDTLKDIRIIQSNLVNRKKSPSDILTDTSYLYLHANPVFRNLIKEHAAEKNITLVTPTEPGILLDVKGRLVNQSGAPLQNILVYVYQTSNKGWYSDTAAHILMNEGDRKYARLFGYLKTDIDGKFEIHTIRPVGYPKSSLPAHIHIECYDKKGLNVLISELLFDDDPRLNAEQRKRASNEGFYISKPIIKSDKSQEVKYDIIIRE